MVKMGGFVLQKSYRFLVCRSSLQAQQSASSQSFQLFMQRGASRESKSLVVKSLSRELEKDKERLRFRPPTLVFL